MSSGPNTPSQPGHAGSEPPNASTKPMANTVTVSPDDGVAVAAGESPPRLKFGSGAVHAPAPAPVAGAPWPRYRLVSNVPARDTSAAMATTGPSPSTRALPYWVAVKPVSSASQVWAEAAGSTTSQAVHMGASEPVGPNSRRRTVIAAAPGFKAVISLDRRMPVCALRKSGSITRAAASSARKAL